MDYLGLLKHSFDVAQAQDEITDRLEFLGVYIFDFTTYDSEMDQLFGKKALEVCKAISDKKTFEYQEDEENYKWFLVMVNMPFFKDKLEWGTSIRGAWWALYGDDKFELNSCGLYEDGGTGQSISQVLELKFNKEQWGLFVTAMENFTADGGKE